jgi:outer membrane protein TolC
VRFALPAVVVVAAGCATDPSGVETSTLSPVPRSAALAEAGGAGAGPRVLPSEQVAGVEKLLADVRARDGATLADCVAFAELTHEDLLSGEEDRLQAALRRDLAFAGLLPNVSITALLFRQDRVPGGSSSASFGDSSSGGSGGSSADREQLALTVRQPIFRGFAELAAIEAADRDEAARAAAIEVIRLGLRRSVARAFFAVLSADAETRTLEEAERLDRARIEEMRARLEAGIARRSELLLLESQLQTTLAAVQRARVSFAVARTVLDRLVGVGVDIPTPLMHAAPAPVATPSRADAIAQALRSRPELVAAGLASEASEASIAVARAGYWPTVAFVGRSYLARSGYSRQSEATKWDAEIDVDFPLFEGGATRARERIAKSNLRKARLAESATLRGVVQDVESVLARASGDAALLETSRRTVEIATENLRLLRDEFAQGVATNLEVLTAQNVLQQAQLDLERQRLAADLDRVELSLALGRPEIER